MNTPSKKTLDQRVDDYLMAKVEELEHDLTAARAEVEKLREVRNAVLAYEKITDTVYALGETSDEDKAYKPEFLRLLRALRETSAEIDLARAEKGAT